MIKKRFSAVFFLLTGVLSGAFASSPPPPDPPPAQPLAVFSPHWFGDRPSPFGRRTVFLNHHIFSIAFNLERGFPDYAAYKLNPALVFGELKAERTLKPDPLLQEALRFLPKSFFSPLSSKDYKGASRFGYDRGHLAPKGSFKGSLYAYEAQYMSNIVPQSRDLNQGPWRVLEEKIRRFVLHGHRVKILTGPLFAAPYADKKAYKKPLPPWPGAVGKIPQAPTGFWKLVLYKKNSAGKNSQAKICAFLMPQDLHGLSRAANPEKFIVRLKNLLQYIPLEGFLKSFRSKEACDFLKR